MPASDWSDVDASARPARFVTGLDQLRADPFFKAQKTRLLDAMQLRGAERVVDIGCGTGDDIAEIASLGGHVAIGVERAATLLDEARRRHTGPAFLAGDARALPLRDASLDCVRVDRVLQHLAGAEAALCEWRRVVRPGGALVVFEPDLVTARIEGMDAAAAATIVGWRAGTRPGAAGVHRMAGALAAAGFNDVRVEPVGLELDDLRRADGMMGLPEWGESAAHAGLFGPEDARRWRDDAWSAWERGILRYSCTYLHGRARAG